MITHDGVHTARGNDIKSAWERCGQFISRISYKLVEDRYKLDVYLGCREVRKHLLKIFIKFGIPEKVDFIRVGDWYIRWNISAKSAPKVVDLLIRISPLPEYWLCPIHFYREGRFLLKDDNGDLLPGQDRNFDFEDEREHKTSISNFRMNIQNKVSISTWLVLPFEEQTAEFHEYVKYLRKVAPFTFSDEHWRLWRYSKSNRLYPAKIDATNIPE